MRPSAGAVLCLLALAAPAVASESPCDAARVDRGRREFKAAYDAGRIQQAFDGLAAVEASCRGYLGQPGDESRSQRLWTISDLSLATYKLGDLQKCRELIEPLEDEFHFTNGEPGLKAVWKSLAFNYHQCDCYDVKRPLCRERSWLKDGFGEIVGQVHDSLPEWSFRLLFDVEDKEEKRADGSTYVESDATMTALEVRSRGGKVLQKLAIEGGTTSYLGSGQSGVRLQLDDRNFDGYQDVGAGNECGNGACCTEKVFLFDPASKRFAHNEALSNVCFSEVDPKKKEIRSSWRASACEHGRTTYRWEKGELVVWEQETETIISAVDQGSPCCSDDEAAAGQCLIQTVLEKRIGGTLKVVSTKKEKAAPEP